MSIKVFMLDKNVISFIEEYVKNPNTKRNDDELEKIIKLRNYDKSKYRVSFFFISYRGEK